MTAEERLIKYYKDAYKKLVKRISELPPGANWERYYKRLLKEIKETVEKLNKTAAKELAELVKTAYTEAEAKALQALPGGPFGGLNRQAMLLVAENAVDELAEANRYFGRHLEDSFRQIGLDAIAEKLATAQTIREAQRRIIEMMQTEGLTAMVDSAGRRHRLDSYAELVARTTTREATNTATTETGRQLGYHLFKFSKHYPTCEVCAPVQDRVFSDSEEDKRFPPLSSVPGFDKGFKTIHPHCRHVLTVTVEALWTDAEREKYLADAKKPIRGDTRTQQEVDRYNAMQAEKRDRWQDRRQYEKYKAVMGDEAPKTFSGFRAIKRSKDSWKSLQGFYRYKLDNPTARRVHYDIYRELKDQGIDRGKVILPSEKATPYILPDNDARDPYHVMKRMLERGVTDEDINKALASSKVMFSQRNDTNRLYFSEDGAVAIIMKGDDWIVKTVWSKDDFNEVMETILRTVNKYV